MSDVTHMLSALDCGDTKAVGELLPLVYEESRRLGAAKLAHEAPGRMNTAQITLSLTPSSGGVCGKMIFPPFL